jgi:aspartate/methionine/tyrosine aminotransferase
MREIVAIADRVGTWTHADEIYRGVELEGEETPSFIGIGAETASLLAGYERVREAFLTRFGG